MTLHRYIKRTEKDNLETTLVLLRKPTKSPPKYLHKQISSLNLSLYRIPKKMKSYIYKCLILLLVFITFDQTFAKRTKPISDILRIEVFLKKTQQWMIQKVHPQETQFNLSTSIVLAGAFCFIASSISSAGGIGGGGLFVPILTIVAGVDLKTASSFSAFMVTGGSIANVIFNLLPAIPKYGGEMLIDFDIALLSQPSMLLGVSIGVVCNLMFPEWLITILFAIFLAWSTSKTCKSGVVCWRMESEGLRRTNGCQELGNGIVREVGSDENDEGVKNLKEPLLGIEENFKLGFPWMKLGVLVLVWCSFCFLYLLRGNRYGQVCNFISLFWDYYRSEITLPIIEFLVTRVT